MAKACLTLVTSDGSPGMGRCRIKGRFGIKASVVQGMASDKAGKKLALVQQVVKRSYKSQTGQS